MVGIVGAAGEKNLMPAKFSEYTFGSTKFSPSWIIRGLNGGKFERKLKAN